MTVCGRRPRGRFLLSDGSEIPEALTAPDARGGPRALRPSRRGQGRHRDGAQPAFSRLYPDWAVSGPAAQVDWREQIDIGPQRPPIAGPGKPDYLWLQGPNQWPAALPELPGIIGQWDAALSEVARTLLRHWAASLGSPPDVFEPAFADTPATLIKVIRYPARAATAQGVGAHKRFRRAHFIVGRTGQPRAAGAARPGGPRTLDRCARRTGRSSSTSAKCSRWRRAAICSATEHRVNLGERSGGVERDLDRILLQPAVGRADTEACRYRPSLPRAPTARRSVGSHLLCLRPQRLEERVRAHPDVAAAHGYSPGPDDGATVSR